MARSTRDKAGSVGQMSDAALLLSEEKTAKAQRKEGPDISLRKGEYLLDEGVFRLSCDHQPLADERFALIGRNKRGLFGAKGTDFRLICELEATDPTPFVMKSSYRFDKNGFATDVAADFEGMVSAGSARHKAQFSFTFKKPASLLRVKQKNNPIELKVPYRRESLVCPRPSLAPYLLLAHRFDREGPDAQSFEWLYYDMQIGGLSMERSFLEGGIVARLDRTNENGERLDLVYFVFTEWPLTTQGRAEDPSGRWHLWTDPEKRLQKMVVVPFDETSGPRQILQRLGGPAALDQVQPNG